MATRKPASGKVRYAVVGTGWFAQDAVLPAFANAKNAELAAIFSGDPEKRDEIGKRYGVPAFAYEDYEDRLKARDFDAVYIVLPNSLHKEYTLHGRPVRRPRPLRETARGHRLRVPRDDRRLRARRRACS